MSLQRELLHLGLYALPYFRVGFWFDLARFDAFARVTHLVRTLGTACRFDGCTQGERREARVAFVMRGILDAGFVSWIPVGVFVLLGSVGDE